MKNFILILCSFFLFVACAQKPIVVSKPSTIDEKQTEVLKEQVLIEPLDIESENFLLENTSLNRIAVIYPSKVVGKYAKSTISTISAYLLFNNKKFQVETFDTKDESLESILTQLNSLKDKAYTKVIALFTKNGFNLLNSIEGSKNLKIYFPLINKKEINTDNNNFVFGGISYEKQIELLQTIASDKNSMFYINSYLGNKLKDSYLNTFGPSILKEIARNNNRFKYIMNDERIIGSTVLLNTPIIKSSIIMTQLTAYEISPSKILSTQLNYNPLLLKLTQERDRENFYVVSSISEVDNYIEDYAKLLGSDITYNWVDYSSLIGIDYLINDNSNSMEPRFINIDLVDNQVNYKQTLYRSTFYGFQKVLTD